MFVASDIMSLEIQAILVNTFMPLSSCVDPEGAQGVRTPPKKKKKSQKCRVP